LSRLNGILIFRGEEAALDEVESIAFVQRSLDASFNPEC
jgi:hypothetical protein